MNAASRAMWDCCRLIRCSKKVQPFVPDLADPRVDMGEDVAGGVDQLVAAALRVV